MAKYQFINIKHPSERLFIYIPASIFMDNAVSLGAKGLYAQLYRITKDIKSLEEVVDYTNNTKEEIDNYFDELIDTGYITIDKKGNAKFEEKPALRVSTIKRHNEDSKEAIEKFKSETKTTEEPLRIRIINMINDCGLDGRINNLLIEYFDNWLFRRGRYGDTRKLTETEARNILNTLNSYQLSTEECIDCIKLSISKEYFQFIDPRKPAETQVKEVSPEEKLEKISGIISTKYQFTDAVNKKLIEYFTRWVNKDGRFSEAEDLHASKVHSILISLRDFKLSEADQLKCVQTSIDKEWYTLVDPKQSNNGTTTSTPPIKVDRSSKMAFDKTTITSGSYTEKDIEELKKRKSTITEY